MSCRETRDLPAAGERYNPAMPYYQHPRPALTVDVVLFAGDDAERKVLLIRRGQSPFRGAWALPGGFVEIDEDLEVAARRELAEETAAMPGELVQIGAFGRPDRDPRGRVVSVAYAGVLPAGEGLATAGSDASEVAWFPVDELPQLAFDHAEIIAAARTQTTSS